MIKKISYLFCNNKDIIKELVNNFKSIEVIDISIITGAQKIWSIFLNRLREDVISKNVNNFLRWKVIKETMFVDFQDYINIEYKQLVEDKLFEKQWKIGLIENSVGNPLTSKVHNNSSGNLIHHNYHLHQFNAYTNLLPHNINTVFEFGGGYGSMCRLFFNLKFRGKYVIYDFKQFSFLQKFYLKSNGLNIYDITEYSNVNSGIFLIHDKEELLLFSKSYDKNNSLFIGTWSISESNLETRNLIFNNVTNFSSYLIAFQINFGELNNLIFFENFKKQFPDLKWSQSEISHLPGNYYLFGN